MTVKPSHRLEWWLLRSLALWLDSETPGTSCRRAMLLGRLGSMVLRREWAWCQTNLRLIYGDGLSQEEYKCLGILAFRNLFMSYVEGLKPDMVTIAGVTNEHYLTDAFNQERGVILASIHLGGWESGLFYRAKMLNLPVACLYRPANNPLSETFIQERRAVHNLEWIPRDDVRGALRALKKGKILVVMSDINFRRGGVAAPFLGLPAMCPPGAGRLALQLGAPLVSVVVVREIPGVNRVVYLPTIPTQDIATSPHAVEEATTRLNQQFAHWIHDYAEQYNWLHARWRTRPNGNTWRADGNWREMARERVQPFATVSDRVRQLLRDQAGKCRYPS
ncbi:MAG: lysophospholipid acyltransferase family protein [Magnetococcales bacterium]|nr:lysophospholipid acyltransferase family protein [Magnetococcales bacterium]